MAEASFESYLEGLEGLEGHKFVKVTKVKKSPDHGAKTLRAQEVRRLYRQSRLSVESVPFQDQIGC